MKLAGRRALRAEAAVKHCAAPSVRLACWLLDSGVQLAQDTHRGGVAGTIDQDGSAHYVYPEITGYYLQWLASRVHRGDPAAQLAAHAGAAQAWLSRWIVAPPAPLTRVHLDDAAADWRNHATFAFDHAMVLRGIGGAAEQGLLTPDRRLTDYLCAALLGMVDADGLFRACVPHSANEQIPVRWSTQRGPFLAKAAAGIVAAARTLAIPAALRRAADATFAASVDQAIDHPHDHTHALLYAMEGALGSPDRVASPAVLSAMADQLTGLFERAQTLGFVPEDGLRSEVRRLDIVAQALRAIALLRRHGCELPGAQDAAEQLSATLASNVCDDGGIPFDPRRSISERNVWTAMFAEQALAWAATGQDADSQPDPYVV